MNVTKLWLTALLFPFAAGCSALHGAHEAQPSEAEMMAKMGEFMTPGPAHKVLEGKLGKWTGHITMWMTPELPPTESTCSTEFTWLLDGRYLQDHTQGDFQGMAFHGIGTTGYDNIKQKYVATWIDNMGTGLMMMEGNYDAGTRTFCYSGAMPDAMQGKYVKGRSVETMADADHWTMQMFTTSPAGEEFKSMEIHYTRAM